jgi:mannose-1-phosphate guanylyltransferase/mannose-6-phosphate isomerase
MTTISQPPENVFTVDRPWGSFQQFLSNAPASVKILTVAPHQRLSLQRHQLRDELWQVIDGPVRVEVDGLESTVLAGERVWVPRLAMHRMSNPGNVDVRVLELAFGHFDEEDIERFEDDYSRVAAPGAADVADSDSRPASRQPAA